MFEHEKGGGVIHLVAARSRPVAEEEGGKGLVRRSCRDGEEGFHFLGPVVIPLLEKCPQSRPLLEVFLRTHWAGQIAMSLLPSS